jgi:hypothetical protein
VKDHVHISSVFYIYVFIHIAHVSLHFSDGTIYLVADGENSGKGVYDDVPESSNHRHGAFRPSVPPPSPPVPPVDLKQPLAPLNAIMQRLVAIDERQAGHLQYHQLPQEFSYLDFLSTHPPVFTEMIDPLEANH